MNLRSFAHSSSFPPWICCFTALTETYSLTGALGIEALTRTLNHFFGHIIQHIFSAGGDIFKFAGDAIFCIWKVDDESTLAETIQTVVDCSLNIQKNYGEWPTCIGVTLRVKIGIATGKLEYHFFNDEFDSVHYSASGTVVEYVRNAEMLCSAGDIILTTESWGYLEKKGVHTRYTYTALPDDMVKVLCFDPGVSEEEKVSFTSAFAGVRPALYALNFEDAPLLKRFISPVVVNIKTQEELIFLSEMRHVTIVFICMPDFIDIDLGTLSALYKIVSAALKETDGLFVPRRVWSARIQGQERDLQCAYVLQQARPRDHSNENKNNCWNHFRHDLLRDNRSSSSTRIYREVMDEIADYTDPVMGMTHEREQIETFLVDFLTKRRMPKHMILLRGETGCGKSHLLCSTVKTAAKRGFKSGTCHASVRTMRNPFSAVCFLLSRLLDSYGLNPHQENNTILEDILGADSSTPLVINKGIIRLKNAAALRLATAGSLADVSWQNKSVAQAKDHLIAITESTICDVVGEGLMDDVQVPDSLQALTVVRMEMLNEQEIVLLKKASVCGKTFEVSLLKLLSPTITTAEINGAIKKLVEQHFITCSANTTTTFVYLLEGKVQDAPECPQCGQVGSLMRFHSAAVHKTIYATLTYDSNGLFRRCLFFHHCQ